MITIAGLVWDNWFSYGDGNFLNTQENKVTQITGKNGTGKSSIPVILGEILYGKNNLGKAKSKLFNRYLDKKAIFANLVFSVDADKYSITYDRKSTLKLALFKNEVDISSHTATDTYKTISSILGYDFNTFWGLIYQSSKDGLEFLTATDTTRKKFLVKLFILDEYIVIHEFFKNEANDKNTDLLINKGKLEVVNSWIETNKKIDLKYMALLPIPNIDKKDIDKLANLKSKLENIYGINKKINYNEQLKSILSGINTSILSENIYFDSEQQDRDFETIASNRLKRVQLKTHIMHFDADIDKMSKLGLKCPVCTQDIESSFQTAYICDKEILKNLSVEEQEALQIENTELEDKTRKASIEMNRKGLQEKVSAEIADLVSKIDNDLSSQVIIEAEIQKQIDSLIDSIADVERQVIEISGTNLIAEAHNSKIKVIKEQLISYNKDKLKLETNIEIDEDLIVQLNIIKKAFSTNGLISYKIENLSKELEEQINLYLAELSKGRFQLKFTISGEKLNIDIIDDGNIIGVEELSAGELARVNTATLLAIRKLMAAISSNKINILFLDEITGVLDEEGKEVLIDILNNENELNTFLVSHEFTHPLIPQVNIIKENKISKIEE